MPAQEYLDTGEERRAVETQHTNPHTPPPGTYGVVYKARDLTAGGRIVALKKIRLDAAAERDGFPQNAVREIKVLTKL